jgi:hypothetical protein
MVTLVLSEGPTSAHWRSSPGAPNLLNEDKKYIPAFAPLDGRNFDEWYEEATEYDGRPVDVTEKENAYDVAKGERKGPICIFQLSCVVYVGCVLILAVCD